MINIFFRCCDNVLASLRHVIFILLSVLFAFSTVAYAQVDFSMNANVGCTSFRVGLDVKNIVPDSTHWEFGDGTKSKGNSVYKIYDNAGVFSIKMTTYKDGTPYVVTKNVTVHKSPVADFEFDKVLGCPPLEVNFKDKSTIGNSPIVKRTWGFANGMVIEGNNLTPTQVFNLAGSRDISLIVEDQNGCTAKKTYAAAVTVWPRPSVDFEFMNSSSCELPVQAIFTNKSSDTLSKYTYQWDFGDGKSSTDVSPSHLFESEGTFNVKLIAKDANGCTNEKNSSNLIVDEKFSVDIIFDDTLGCDILDTKFRPEISSLYRSITWTIDPRLNIDMVNMRLSSDQLGVYPVKLEATSQFGCTISTVKNVYVRSLPKVDFIANPTLSCRLPEAITFTNQTQFGDKYNWSITGGITSTADNPVISINKRGVFGVRLTATSEYGCENSLFKQNYLSLIEPLVEMEATSFLGCAPLNSSFSIKCTNGFTISNIQWDFGNGNTFTGLNPPSQNFPTAKNYTVKATVSFAEGCNNIVITKVLNVGSTQNINATISSTDICPSETITGQISPISNATYEWSIGNITKIASRTFSYKFEQSGTFPISAEVTTNGCKSSKVVGSVKVKPTAANFTVFENCSGGSVSFRNSNYVGVQSTWDFGDGTKVVNDNRNVTHTYKNYGTYLVKLSVYNSGTGCHDEIVKTVEVKKKNTDGFDLKPTIGCSPLPVYYQSFSTSNSNYWYIDSQRYAGTIFSQVFDIPGSYDVTLISINDGCRDSIMFKNLIQVVKPEAGFKFNPIGGCAPITVDFEDTSKSSLSTVNKYNWKIGNFATQNVKDFTRTFDLTAIVPITLTVEDNFGCKDTVMHNLVVARPFAEFQLPSASFCTGNIFRPKNLSTGVGLTYQWDFGDGSPIVTDSAPQHIYTKEGVYDLNLKIIDANNCESIKNVPNAVTIQDIDYDFTAFPTSKHCPELLTDFTIIPQNITYKRTIWDLGDGTIIDDTTRNPKYLFMEAGIFDVTLTLEDYRGCTEVIKKEKLIDIGGPSGDFNVTYSSVCAPVEVLIVADIKKSIANFWDYGDGNGKYETDAHSQTKHIYTEPGVYTPSVTVDDGLGCIVTVYGPELRIGGARPKIHKETDIVCTGEFLQFADISTFEEHAPIVKRTWTFSDGFTTTDSTFSRNIITTDSMDVFITLEIEDVLGCKNIARDTFRVFKNAPLAVNPEMVICKGDTVQLLATRVHNYEWTQSGSLSDINIANPLAFPLQTTEYSIRGYVSPTCFTDKKVKVVVKEAFSGTAGVDTVLCIGDSAKIWVEHEVINSGVFNYQWSLNGQVIDTVPSLVVSPEVNSTYLVNVKNGACKDFNMPVTVEVRAYPSLSVNESSTILSGQEIKLEAVSESGVTYTWSPAPSTGCSNCPFAFVSPTSTTTYTVTVQNQDGCSVSENISVDVIKGCDDEMIEIQNVFSPNNDGLNDRFTLQNNQLIKLGKIRIYSRTGEIVFESSNILDAWDGTFNGVLLNSGVYVYYLEAQCKNGEPLLLKGNITLLR